MDLLISTQQGVRKGNWSPDFPVHTILFFQLILFAVLYAVWVLPGTIALRNTCLIGGAVLSVYPILKFRNLLFQKSAAPFWLLAALLFWATFHLLFLSQNPVLQYQEYTSIWKRAAIGAIFAFGMGLSIARLRSSEVSRTYRASCWVIFYTGLLAPTLIYLAKTLIALYGQRLGLVIVSPLQAYLGPSSVYIAKTAYVAFCIPVLAVALGSLLNNIRNHQWLAWGNIFYVSTLPAVFLVFFLENIKNGFIYGGILICTFLFFLLLGLFKGHSFLKILLGCCIIFSALFVFSGHIKQNASWQTFEVDAKIAWQTEKYPQWKYNGTQGYPNNELGGPVSVTNYERIAWAKEGMKLIAANPLGYGLIERSFGHWAKMQWPDSKLHQSHSGWIDLTLGIGIPGLLLVLSALGAVFWQLNRGDISSSKSELIHWKQSLTWILVAIFLIWFTTEISQKTYFEAFIFWISLAAGMVISRR